MTKEELLKENTKLEEIIKRYKGDDQGLREQFMRVLGLHKPSSVLHSDIIGTYSADEIPSWEEIFFRVGELNSDANYTILLLQKRELEATVDMLEREKRESNKDAR